MKSIIKYLIESEDQTNRSRVGVFIINNNKLVVGNATQSNNPYKYKYIIPGGGIDPGETIQQTAIRESREEIAVVPTNIKIIKHINNPYKYCGLKERGFKYDCSTLYYVYAEKGKIDKSVWGIDDGFKTPTIELSVKDMIQWLYWCIKETDDDFVKNTKYKIDMLMLNELIKKKILYID